MGMSKIGRVRCCFNALDCYKKDLQNGMIPYGGGVCRGIVKKDNTLQKRCITCKWMNKETQSYIESKTCCACTHFHWGMGEMGTCDLKEYRNLNDIGEWSDSCSNGKFEYKYE